MKGKKIIDYIVRADMPDMAEVKKNIHRELDDKLTTRLAEKNIFHHHSRKYARYGITVALILAINMGVFDFGNYGQPSDPPESGSTIQTPLKRGSMLMAYAAESPNTISEKVPIKRGINNMITISDTYIVTNRTDNARPFQMEKYTLFFETDNSDMKSYQVKSIANASHYMATISQVPGLLEESVFSIQIMKESEIFYPSENEKSSEMLAVTTNGQKPVTLVIEVTFTDDEIEEYTLTLTPKENPQSDFATFEISFD